MLCIFYKARTIYIIFHRNREKQIALHSSCALLMNPVICPQSENHSCTADFPKGPQGRGEAGETPHSPFIEHALLFWRGQQHFWAAFMPLPWLDMQLFSALMEHFNSDSLKGQKNHVLGCISWPQRKDRFSSPPPHHKSWKGCKQVTELPGQIFTEEMIHV